MLRGRHDNDNQTLSTIFNNSDRRVDSRLQHVLSRLRYRDFEKLDAHVFPNFPISNRATRQQRKCVIASGASTIAPADRSDSKARTSRAGVSIIVTDGGSTGASRLAIECRSIGRRAAHADVWRLECRSCSEWKINRANEEGAVNPPCRSSPLAWSRDSPFPSPVLSLSL